MRIAYLVHDLADPAVHRRVRMLREGGADLALLGFRRRPDRVDQVAGVPAMDLGRTADARLARRAGSVAAAAAKLPLWAPALRGADAVLARQVETLALAAMARAVAAPRAKLTYECLDVHRLMTAPSAPGRALRVLEGRLLRRCALLIVSSPAFVREHFARAYPALPPVRLVENRVLESELPAGELTRLASDRDEAGPCALGLAPGPPWRIGWFGNIRCVRSLALLAALVRALPGQVEVVIRGRPARTAVPQFDQVVAETPGLHFLGPYDRATELAAIYRDVHFTWAMDFYETGANSDWLLPNRLYEGGLYGTVPIAFADVETGRWLAARNAGLLLREPLDRTLPELVRCMDTVAYAVAKASAGAIPLTDLVYRKEDSAALCAALALAEADQGVGCTHE